MLNRIEPLGPAAAYKTYGVYMPSQTHRRPATCAEVECPAHINGWRTKVHEADEMGQRQAHYIRKQSGRKFTEAKDETGLTVFTFEAGQKCFGEHSVPLDRPPLFVVRDGDWRGNPRGTQPRYHRNGEDFVEDFAQHQQTIADAIQEG